MKKKFQHQSLLAQNDSSVSGKARRGMRIAQELRKALGQIFHEYLLPKSILNENNIFQPLTFHQMGTRVSRVVMSRDLSHGKIYILVSCDVDEKKILKILKQTYKQMRFLSAQHLNLKYVPQFSFHIDTEMEKELRIDILLNSMKDSFGQDDNILMEKDD